MNRCNMTIHVSFFWTAVVTDVTFKLKKFINFTVSVISRMYFIFSTGFGAPLGKIKLNQFQPGEWCFLGRSEGSTFTEKLMKLNPQVNEELKNFKQLNKLINFTVSVISCMFFIFYKLWAQVYLSNVLLHDHHHACLSFILLVLTYQQVSPLFYRSTKFSVKNTKFWPRMLEFSLGCHLGC